MLHARIDLSQILDKIQVGCEITEFHAGEEPTRWYAKPEVLELPAEDMNADALTIVISAIRLWSERTNHK